MASAAMATKKAFSKLVPLFDRVVVQKWVAETTTKSGVLIPDKAQSKVLEATVVAVGPGKFDFDGKKMSMSVQAGDNVLLPEYGGTKVTINGDDFYVYRDGDIIGKLE